MRLFGYDNNTLHFDTGRFLEILGRRMRKMSKILNVFVVILISLVSSLLLLASSCKSNPPAIVTYPTDAPTTASQEIVPYIPPAYYQCIAVLPMQLVNAYFSNYGNSQADQMYDGQVFVFQNLLVDAYMISQVGQDNLLAYLITCPIVNIADAKNLKVGDQIDIVGTCVGRDPNQSGWLLFEDCYVLTAGSIQLPAPGGSTFVPAY
jgi:hypothetical protein